MKKVKIESILANSEVRKGIEIMSSIPFFVGIFTIFFFFKISSLHSVFISRNEIDDFLKLPLNIKLTAIGYAKKAAYLTLAELYKAKGMQKEPAQNKKIEEIELDENQKRLLNEIDMALNNESNIYNDIKITNNTSNILKNIGLEDLPILMSKNILRIVCMKKETIRIGTD